MNRQVPLKEFDDICEWQWPYQVDFSKRTRQKRGQASQRDSIPDSRKLTDLEESVIVHHILDLTLTISSAS